MRRPTRDEWEAELNLGWAGPDGSSSSLDDIEGVRIGITSRDYRHVDLPANRHDFYYRLGRKHQLGLEYRKAADVYYRDACIARVASTLIGWRVKVGKARAWMRYVALRAFGGVAWTSSP